MEATVTNQMSEQLNEIFAALCKFQSEIERIGYTDEGIWKNKYASYDEIMEKCKPIYTKYGLIVTFPSHSGYSVEKDLQIKTNKSTKGEVIGTTETVKTVYMMTFSAILGHTSGQYIVSSCTLPLVKSNDAQGYGGAKTYSKRFLVSGLLGITCGEPDDDGASGSGIDVVINENKVHKTEPVSNSETKNNAENASAEILMKTTTSREPKSEKGREFVEKLQRGDFSTPQPKSEGGEKNEAGV